MKPLNLLERFIMWIARIPEFFCRHEVKHDFSTLIELGWERASGSFTCLKCGMDIPYYASFTPQGFSDPHNPPPPSGIDVGDDVRV